MKKQRKRLTPKLVASSNERIATTLHQLYKIELQTKVVVKYYYTMFGDKIYIPKQKVKEIESLTLKVHIEIK